MADHTYATTKELIDNQFDILDLQQYQTIETRGYYDATDGGGATFTVRAKAEGETPDNFFTFETVINSMLIVALDIPNGIVNIDQLGAKSGTVLPSCYYAAVSNINVCNDRTEQTTISSAAMDVDGKNAARLTSALNNSNVRVVKLTAGKVYGVHGEIGIASNKKLDGCGATIMNLNLYKANTDSPRMLYCRGTPNNFVHDVEICNLRLIGNVWIRNNSLFGSVSAMEGVWIKYGKKINIHNVQIERCGTAIHITNLELLSQDCFNQVDVNHVIIKDSLMGIQYNAVHNSHITNCSISVDYTELSHNRENKLHCIYANNWVQNCTFSHLILKNAHGGCGIIMRSQTNTFPYNIPPTENIIVKDVCIDSVHKALGPDINVRNIWIQNISATNIYETGMILRSAENIVLINSSFSGYGENGGVLFSGHTIEDLSVVSFARNILVPNCSFRFTKSIVHIDNSHKGENDRVKFQDCNFSVSVMYPDWSPSVSPSYTRGLIARIQWIGCAFEMYEFPDLPVNINKMRTWNEMKGRFFFLDGSTYPDYSQYWTFDKCLFVNHTNLTVNSPICSNYENDFYGRVYCAMQNCIMERFRWTIRIAPQIAYENIVSSSEVDGIVHYKVNPCCIGNNNSLKGDAADCLTDTGRFVGKNNWFCERDLTTDSRTRYAIAEEFGR